MSGKKIVLANSFYYTFSSFLVKAFGFFLLPVYTEYLSPGDYGITNLVHSFLSVATFLVSFSLYAAIPRFYVEYKEDQEKVKSLIGSIITFTFIMGLLFFVVSSLFSKVIIRFLFTGIPFYPYVLIALITLLFQSLHTIHENVLKAIQKGRFLASLSVIIFLLQTGITIVFVVILKLGPVGVLLSQAIVSFLYSIFMVSDLRKRNLLSFSFNWKLLKRALSYSIPIIPHNLSTSIAAFVSKIFINNSASLASVGLYGIAMQFGSLIDLFQTSVNKAFSPWFFNVLHEGKGKSDIDQMEFAKILLSLYSVIYLGIGLFSQEAILLMTHSRYTLAWKVVPILVVAFSVKSIYYFYVNILFYHQEAARKIFYASLTGSFLDISLAAVLIPRFGMYGAALSFLIAKVCIVVIVVLLCRNYNQGMFDVLGMIRTILPSIVLIGIGLIFSYVKYDTVFNYGNFLYKCGIVGGYLAILLIHYKSIIYKIIEQWRNKKQR
ncbi:MAG: lipopolysaccharide biosynthesis protein [Clostridia bacterium]